MTTQEGKSSTERLKIQNFLLNPDNEALMTYMALQAQFNCVFNENKDVC